MLKKYQVEKAITIVGLFLTVLKVVKETLFDREEKKDEKEVA